MKRTIGIFLVTVMALTTLTACGSSPGIELTDDQNEMVAEYLAGVLLKHNLRYEEALIYETDHDLENTDTDEPKDAGNTDSEKEKDQQTEQKPEKQPDPDTSKSEETIANAVSGYSKMKDIYGSYGFQVTYSGYELCSNYPKNPEDSYFLLEADKGKKLLMVSFRVKNSASKRKKVDFMDAGISYRVDDGQGMAIQPMLTGLTDDMQTLKTDIAGGKSEKAVVAFMVPKGINLDNYALYVSKDKMTAKVPLGGSKS